MKKIYFYNNYTNLPLPEKIDVYPVSNLLGDTIEDIKSKINPNTNLFCVFTHIQDADIVVPNDEDKDIIQMILNRSGRKEVVETKTESIWYCDKVEKTIIFSDTCKFLAADINSILYNFLKMTDVLNQRNIKPVEMYIVQNTRNSEVLIKTPNKEEAISVCDKNPCCVIKTRDETIIYRSRYGRTSLTSSIRRAKAKQSQSNGVFHIKIS
jgi:hypothetical protein